MKPTKEAAFFKFVDDEVSAIKKERLEDDYWLGYRDGLVECRNFIADPKEAA